MKDLEGPHIQLACEHCGHAFDAPGDYDFSQMRLCPRCSGALDVEEHELPNQE